VGHRRSSNGFSLPRPRQVRFLVRFALSFGLDGGSGPSGKDCLDSLQQGRMRVGEEDVERVRGEVGEVICSKLF
jgi:hypothetical protein